MKRWVFFAGFAIAGLIMAYLAWEMPAHLRAVDTRVLRLAGAGSPSLSDHGLQLIRENRGTAAQLMLSGAQRAGVPANVLAVALENLTPSQSQTAPALLTSTLPASGQRYTVTEMVLKNENRTRLLQSLSRVQTPSTRALLYSRTLTNLTLLPPSSSSAGQAFDAAVIITALLIEEHRLTPTLSNQVYNLTLRSFAGPSSAPGAASANSQYFEQMLLDILSLAQRFTWDQLATFIADVQDPETLRHLARLIRTSEGNLPVFFTAVQVSGNPRAVADYLMAHSRTGYADLATSLHFRTGGVKELLERNLRVFRSGTPLMMPAFETLALRAPQLALMLKWLLYLASGFCFAIAVHFILPVRAPYPVRGFHLAREFLFALGFLVVVLLLSEPFIAQDSQKIDFPFKLRLPMASTAAAPELASSTSSSSIMNQLSLLTLLLFFVIQSLIYLACVLKLAEIRRQRIDAPLKLKLLENEDHLFDAGLYLGFVGTIISLILVSLGVIKPSLMAAYSSTSFGIIFVSFFKIFHLRPYRRKLLMESNPGALDSRAPRSVPSAA